MNERIRQLAEEASDQTDWWDVSYPFIDKFAELIIKECATAVAKANNPLGRNIDKVFEMHFRGKK